MPWTLKDCAAALKQTDLRHHHDEAERTIRLVFVTSRYRNLRGEHLAVVTMTTPVDGQLLRVSIERVTEAAAPPADTCLAACRFAAAMPLVGVEYDAEFDNLRLVVESLIEDSPPTPSQLHTMIGRLIEAAEIWSVVSSRSQGNDQRFQLDGGSEKAA